MMVTYSKYRRSGMSESRKALIYAAIIAFLWLMANEIEYREIVSQQVTCGSEA